MIPAQVRFSPHAVDGAAFADLHELCERLGFLPTFRHGLLLQVAMPEPVDEASVAAIRRATHREVRPFGVDPADFRAAWDAADAGRVSRNARPARAAGAAVPLAPHAWRHALGPGRALALEIVAYAFAVSASDILLDDQQDWHDIAVKRFGAKEILPPVTRDVGAALLRACKEMAGLPVAAALAAQSGAARVAIAPGRRIDLRIEVTPTIHGESLVARLHDAQTQLERMQRLPFAEPGQAAEVAACLAQAQGLIVATGPTGHGKTTTLYACLGQLDRSRLNIRTLEDPVEFPVPWITQIPVGGATGRDFASGLKSLLRQAPHVILLGELRDRAAAQTCMEAVDTGHLLLATLHTRDAVGVVSRLLDLGLTGRQIAAGLRLAIGQRLVPCLCARCRVAAPVRAADAAAFEAYELPAPDELFEASGCPSCGSRGERGVVPVFELFQPGAGEDMEDLIACADAAHFSERELRRRWRRAGGDPLARGALRLAAQGVISVRQARLLF